MSDQKMESLDYLGFQRQSPSAHLADFVECYWTVHRSTPLVAARQEFLYPEGGCGVIYNFGSPWLFNGTQPASRFTQDGTKNSRTGVEFQGEIDAIGIRFKPGGAMPFMRSPLHEWQDQTLELEGKELFQLGYEISEEITFRDRIVGIEKVLSALLLQSTNLPPQPLLLAIRSAASSQSTVSSLAQSVGIGARQLERYFKQYVGVTPKNYLQFQRIAVARKLLKQASHLTCTQIGLEVGFYDQSHFNHVFQSVTGKTPKAYRDRKQRYQ